MAVREAGALVTYPRRCNLAVGCLEAWEASFATFTYWQIESGNRSPSSRQVKPSFRWSGEIPRSELDGCHWRWEPLHAERQERPYRRLGSRDDLLASDVISTANRAFAYFVTAILAQCA